LKPCIRCILHQSFCLLIADFLPQPAAPGEHHLL
jgi:hypothetical protein